MSKSNIEHFYDICHNIGECTDTYNKGVIDNYFASYEDTAPLASFMSDIGDSIPPDIHKEIYKAFVKKGDRKSPRYIKSLDK